MYKSTLIIVIIMTIIITAIVFVVAREERKKIDNAEHYQYKITYDCTTDYTNDITELPEKKAFYVNHMKEEVTVFGTYSISKGDYKYINY